jgi:hypothetical protein
MRSWKFLLPLLATSLCFAAQPDRVTAPVDSSRMVALQNHVSPFARTLYDQGPVEPSHPLSITMLFTPTVAQRAALQKLVEDQQNPKSPSFHAWLTPEQYGDRFGLSQNDVDKVTAWLQSQGFKVVYTARGRDFISFSGNAALVQSAFKTEIHYYNINGAQHFSNSASPMIPVALSGVVGGFRGLHDFVPRRMSTLHNPNSSLLHSDYTFTTGQGTFTALAPGDIATIYDINPLYQATTPIDGTGQKMVVVGQTDIYLADLNFFRTDFGLSTINNCTTNSSGVITACDTTNFKFIIAPPSVDPGVNAGDLSESDLDIEWSGSVARNAQIIFVTSDANSGGVSNSASYAIDNDLAPVISISYGLCEAYSTPPSLTVQDAEYLKGAGLGISIFAATGDEAAATCDGDVFSTPVSTATLGQSVSYPASSPEVTAVGGTEFNEGTGTYWGATNGTNGASVLPNGPLNGYIPELGWNDTTAGASQGVGLDGTGGGPSNCVNTTGSTTEAGFPFNFCAAPNGGFTKPTYQTSLTPSDGVRDVPDISFSASNFNDPYIVCTAQSETTGSASTSTCVTSISDALITYNSAFGGTSVSTPVAAGMAVLLNQYLGSTKGLGNINTQVYELFSSNPSSFHDIVAGTSSTDGDTSNNVVPCTPNTPSFEPPALQCPAGGTLGYSAGTGYDLVTGLGSIDFNSFFAAWKASLAPDFQLSAGTLSLSPVPAGQQTTTTLTIAPISGSAAMTVNFAPGNCTGLPAGASCTFNPTSVYFNGTSAPPVTLTIFTLANSPLGTQTVTITPTNSPNTSTTVSLTVSATNQTFSITPGAATYSVAPGATASVAITVAGTNGFIIASSTTTALPITYTCLQSSLPSDTACAFSPGSGNSVSTTAVSLSLSTIAPTSQLRSPLSRGNHMFYALLLPGLFGMVFAAGSRSRGARLLGLIVVLSFSTLWLGACGGGSSRQSNPGTPAGSYTVVVNATTGGSVPLTGTMNVHLTVQ